MMNFFKTGGMRSLSVKTSQKWLQLPNCIVGFGLLCGTEGKVALDVDSYPLKAVLQGGKAIDSPFYATLHSVFNNNLLQGTPQILTGNLLGRQIL